MRLHRIPIKSYTRSCRLRLGVDLRWDSHTSLAGASCMTKHTQAMRHRRKSTPGTAADEWRALRLQGSGLGQDVPCHPRPADQWASRMPVQSPCGKRASSPSMQDRAKQLGHQQCHHLRLRNNHPSKEPMLNFSAVDCFSVNNGNILIV